jgi:glycogen synthase
VAFQNKVGLNEDPDAPLFFWPSRLDPVQKGPQLLADILYKFLARHWNSHAQVVLVANGSFKHPFCEILNMHDLYGRLAVCDFNQALSMQGFAASDFTLVPSRFEPCGLPQMVGQIYGSLPVVHDTGGLHDTVEHLECGPDAKGNGFVFKVYDSFGLSWAMDRAMDFYKQDESVKEAQISRIMTEADSRFNHEVCAASYIKIYEKMLDRPLVKSFE